MPRWMSFTLVFSIFMIGALFFMGPNNFMKVVELKKEIKELKKRLKPTATPLPSTRRKSVNSTPTR